MDSMAITCCNGCVPPKRTPTCHATCTEYTEQKAKHEADMERVRKERDVQAGLCNQMFNGVRRAERRKRNHKGG